MHIEIWKPVERGQAGMAKSQQMKINAKRPKNAVKTQPMLVGSILRSDALRCVRCATKDSGLSTFEQRIGPIVT